MVDSLQLSSFVEYTWQCMKLPTLDSEDMQLTSREEPVMADADSTTQGE